MNPFENDDDEEAAPMGETTAGAEAGSQEAATPGPFSSSPVPADTVVDGVETPKITFVTDARAAATPGPFSSSPVPADTVVDGVETPKIAFVTDARPSGPRDGGREAHQRGDDKPVQEEARRCFVLEWLRSIGQNALFLLAVVPVTLALLLEVTLSLGKCCLLCRPYLEGPLKQYRLSYNMAFLALVFNKFLTGESARRQDHRESHEYFQPEEEDSPYQVPSAPPMADVEPVVEAPKSAFLTQARSMSQEEPERKDEKPQEEAKDQGPGPARQWIGAFFQNVLFLLVVLPVTSILVIDFILSMLTLCLLCRTAPNQEAQHFRLLFNFAFFSNLCGRCLYGMAGSEHRDRAKQRDRGGHRSRTRYWDRAELMPST